MRYSIVVGPNRHKVAGVVPAYPESCSCFLVVRFSEDMKEYKELAYWDSGEWVRDESLDAIGAIMGAVRLVNKGHDFLDYLTAPGNLNSDWKRWEES